MRLTRDIVEAVLAPVAVLVSLMYGLEDWPWRVGFGASVLATALFVDIFRAIISRPAGSPIPLGGKVWTPVMVPLVLFAIIGVVHHEGNMAWPGITALLALTAHWGAAMVVIRYRQRQQAPEGPGPEPQSILE